MPVTKIRRFLLAFVGFIVMGIGLYFALARPAFLPEDVAFIGAAQPLDIQYPRLGLWLHRVFLVLGGFIFSTGLLVVAQTFIMTQRRFLRNTLLFGAFLASIGLMTVVNFSIDSSFRWALLALALVWLLGILLRAALE
jgi:hypothetical protein